MSKSLAMLPVLWWLVLLTSPAGGLEERWGVEIVSSARSLPLVVDVDGDGRSETLVTTRFDGSLWNLASDGAVLGRARRDHWLEGSVAAAFHAGSTTPLLAFQESTGLVNLVDYGRGLDVRQDVPGQPCIGSAPCIADLDADGVPEVVCARMNGVVTVLDATAAPRWQFDCGSSFHASPACAPVFGNSAALYLSLIHI